MEGDGGQTASRRAGSGRVMKGWSRLVFRRQHNGKDAPRARRIRRILGAELKVAIVAIDVPEEALAVEVEAAEVMLAERVVRLVLCAMLAKYADHDD